MSEPRGGVRGPTEDSILFDLDMTLFDLGVTLLGRVRERMPGYRVLDEMPLTRHFAEAFGPLSGAFSMECIQKPRLFADEPVYPAVKELVNLLVESGFDVWFVTAPLGEYHRGVCVQEKKAQVQRHFGAEMAEKVIFRSDKYKVPGFYLIDDNAKLVTEGASWRRVLFAQDHNKGVDCPRRIDKNDCVHQFRALLEADGRRTFRLE